MVVKRLDLLLSLSVFFLFFFFYFFSHLFYAHFRFGVRLARIQFGRRILLYIERRGGRWDNGCCNLDRGGGWNVNTREAEEGRSCISAVEIGYRFVCDLRCGQLIAWPFCCREPSSYRPSVFSHLYKLVQHILFTRSLFFSIFTLALQWGEGPASDNR